MAAAAMSSPLGFSTSVMPRYLSVKHIPSSSGSCISAQLSGSSAKTKSLSSTSHVPAAPWLVPAEPPHPVAASLLPAAVLLPALSRAPSCLHHILGRGTEREDTLKAFSPPPLEVRALSAQTVSSCSHLHSASGAAAFSAICKKFAFPGLICFATSRKCSVLHSPT